MTQTTYLMDTHALIFWSTQESVSDEFLLFFDRQEQHGNLFVSPISFWETAFLVKRGRIELDNIYAWKDELLSNSGIQLLSPTAAEMIDSVNLPTIHKDPFDRLLVAQARQNNCRLVTVDTHIKQYEVETFWLK